MPLVATGVEKPKERCISCQSRGQDFLNGTKAEEHAAPVL